MSSFILGSITAAVPTNAGSAVGAYQLPNSVDCAVVTVCPVTALGNNAANPPVYSIPGVILPPISTVGQIITILNNGVGVCAVYTIPTANGVGGANLAVTINNNQDANGFMRPFFVGANGGCVRFISGGSNQWACIQDNGLKTLPVATAATAITLDDSFKGVMFAFPAMAGASTITLPAPYSGWNFKAIATGTIGNAVSFTSTAANMNGVLEIVVGAGTACTAIAYALVGQTTVRFTATAVKGDLLEVQASDLIANVKGFGQAAASFSVA